MVKYFWSRSNGAARPAIVYRDFVPGVLYYAGMPLVMNDEGKVIPTEGDPEFISMWEYQPDVDIRVLEIPVIEVLPTAIYEKWNEDGSEEEVRFGGGGSGGDIDALIDGSIVEVSSNTITKIIPYALTQREALESACFPSVTEAGEYAFNNCSSLKSIDLPLLEIVAQYMFNMCKALESVDFPFVTEVASYAFSSCSALKSANMPNLTTVNNSAFSSTGLTSIDLSKVTNLSGSAFYKCKSLAEIELPLVEVINSATFRDCSKLTKVDLAKTTSIAANAFYGCSALTTLVLRADTVCALSNKNAFDNTPYALYSIGSNGNVYVPENLIVEYQNATNWSSLYSGGSGHCQFVAIEGSEYE